MGRQKNINYIAVSIKGSKKTRYRLTEPNHRIGKTFLFHFLRIVHFLEGVSVSEISTMVGVVSPSNIDTHQHTHFSQAEVHRRF